MCSFQRDPVSCLLRRMMLSKFLPPPPSPPTTSSVSRSQPPGSKEHIPTLLGGRSASYSPSCMAVANLFMVLMRMLHDWRRHS